MALDFFAGCVGGAAGVIVGHPLDTVKVRLQIQSVDNIKYRGTFDCLRTTVKNESIRGLYKGISSPLLGVAGVNALIFGVYGALRPYVHGQPGNNSLWAHFLAGSISGAVQSFVASPMELVKTRMQLNDASSPLKKPPSSWDVLRKIYQKEGGLFRGVFKGWGVTLVREIPGFGTYFATYEALTTKCGHEVGTFGMMLAGGLAGVFSWIVTFPIDVVKTRLQSDVTGKKYSGAIDCFKKTLAAEGYPAFFRGLNSAIIRAFPTNAATFTVVTWIMRWADERQGERNENGENYLEELLAETARIQDRFEGSIKLNLPHYYQGYVSISTGCAAMSMKYGQSTRSYFNFYDLIQAASVDDTKTLKAAEAGNGVGGGGLIKERMLEAFKNEKRDSCIDNNSSITKLSTINNSSSISSDILPEVQRNAIIALAIREKEFSHGTSLPLPLDFSSPSPLDKSDAPVSHTNPDLKTLPKIIDLSHHIISHPTTTAVNYNEDHEQQTKTQIKNNSKDKVMGEGASSPSSRVLNLRSIVEGFFENILPTIRLCSCSDDNCVCFS